MRCTAGAKLQQEQLQSSLQQTSNSRPSQLEVVTLVQLRVIKLHGVGVETTVGNLVTEQLSIQISQRHAGLQATEPSQA